MQNLEKSVFGSVWGVIATVTIHITLPILLVAMFLLCGGRVLPIESPGPDLSNFAEAIPILLFAFAPIILGAVLMGAAATIFVTSVLLVMGALLGLFGLTLGATLGLNYDHPTFQKHPYLIGATAGLGLNILALSIAALVTTIHEVWSMIPGYACLGPLSGLLTARFIIHQFPKWTDKERKGGTGMVGGVGLLAGLLAATLILVLIMSAMTFWPTSALSSEETSQPDQGATQALHTLPLSTAGLTGADLILLHTSSGVWALTSEGGAPRPWTTTPVPLPDLLTSGNYANFGNIYYSGDGRHATLDFLPADLVGRTHPSPDGQFLAYTTVGEFAAAGPALFLYHLTSGENTPISGYAALYGWSPLGPTLFARNRDNQQLYQLNPHELPDPMRGTISGWFNPQGEVDPVAWFTADNLRLWREGNTLKLATFQQPNNPRTPFNTSNLTLNLHPERPFAVTHDGQHVAWLNQRQPQLHLRPLTTTLNEYPWYQQPLGESENEILRLAWSPDSTQLLIWATDGCLDGAECWGDLYLVNPAIEASTPVLRLTEKQWRYDELLDMAWLRR